MPIQSTLAAGALAAVAGRQAKQFASNVAEGVQSFAETLRAEGNSPGHEQPTRTLTEIESEIARRIRDLLDTAGLAPNHRFDLIVSETGRVWVTGADSDRGAIEAALNDSAELTDLLLNRARQGRSSLGWPRFVQAIERAKLTPKAVADKTLGSPGGYPNW